MRNKLFQEALDDVSEESQQKVREYTDAIDMAVDFGEWLLRNCEIDTDSYWRYYHNRKYEGYKTTSELFQIFKSQINEIQHQ